MKIKKIGHCCFVIEVNNRKIMTDPGFYTVEEQSKEKNINLIIITHEHKDHLHIESLKEIVKNNPNAKIITNNGVGKLLKELGIKYEVLENKVSKKVIDIDLEAHDCKHEEIYKEYLQVQNTAYFIDKRLFYPGDSFYNPGKPVEILALPVSGGWVRIRDAVNYALEVNPKICFPVHDGGLNAFGGAHKVPDIFLTKAGIVFKNFEEIKEENL
jgi:L-ascorbate metabolism protein UlaG (beta-lactamase superfamily)